jgi:hypothetical protein
MSNATTLFAMVSGLRSLRRLGLVAWAIIYIVVNFLTVSRWRQAPMPHAVLNVLTGTSVLKGWPVVEPDEWIVVEGEAATTQFLSGSVEDWLPPLIKEGRRAYRPQVAITYAERGLWSPWWQTATLTRSLTSLVGNDRDRIERDWALVRPVYVQAQIARGADADTINLLCEGTSRNAARVRRTDVFVGFIINDLGVLVVAAVGVLNAKRLAADVRERSRLKALASGKCPFCRYDLSGQQRPATCTECGRTLPWPSV